MGRPVSLAPPRGRFITRCRASILRLCYLVRSIFMESCDREVSVSPGTVMLAEAWWQGRQLCIQKMHLFCQRHIPTHPNHDFKVQWHQPATTWLAEALGEVPYWTLLVRLLRLRVRHAATASAIVATRLLTEGASGYPDDKLLLLPFCCFVFHNSSPTMRHFLYNKFKHGPRQSFNALCGTGWESG